MESDVREAKLLNVIGLKAKPTDCRITSNFKLIKMIIYSSVPTFIHS